MDRARWSRTIFRLVLWLYPVEFRDRFGADVEADFAELIARRGWRVAWRRALGELAAALRLTHATARTAARRRLFSHPPQESSMGSLVFDLRHAVRALLHAPVFTVVTIATLALGIGANSAIFCLLNAALIRPLGYPGADRLMLVYEALPQSGVPRIGVSPPDVLDLQNYQRSFSATGAYRNRSMELSGDGDAEQVTTAHVTPHVLPLLGVGAASGRTLSPEDGSEERIAVISHGLWQRRYGGRDVLGRRITLDRQPYTVVGVMPAAFQFPKRGPTLNGEPADIWVPLVFNPFERQARGMMYTHTVIGRLREGVSVTQAAADLGALAPRIRENYPVYLRNTPMSLEVLASPFADDVAGQVRRPLLILLGAVGLVLLVACANVANLFLTRAVSRAREIGLRVALGAERRRLFQMLVAESLLLALASGALGLVLGHWVLRAMPAAIVTSLPGVADVTLDGRVVAFTFALSAITALVFGLVPLAAGGRRRVNDALREGGTRLTGGARQHRVQSTLVVSSVALAFVLLIGAGLLLRSFTRLVGVDPGLRTSNVLTLRVSLPYAGYDNAGAVRRFYRTLHDGLRGLAGVRAASISSDLPITADGERRAFTPDRAGDAGGLPPSVAVTWIHGDFFATYGLPLMRGRTFSPEEEADNRQVAVVNRALASRFWPGEDPIGKRLKWGIAASMSPWKTIVGVSGDVVDGALGSDPIIHVYVPYTDVPDAALGQPLGGLLRQMTIAIHTDRDARRMTPGVRAAISAIDPALAVTDVETMEKVVAEAAAPQRFSAQALTMFAIGALLMAGVGLYGVLAFGVSERTREIGVRVALGATASEVIGLVLRRGMTLAAAGLLLGLLGSLAAARLIRTQLYATDVYDLSTFAAVPLVLAIVSLAACYLPARRAARVDPAVALRGD